jgi:hypothetical protein
MAINEDQGWFYQSDVAQACSWRIDIDTKPGTESGSAPGWIPNAQSTPLHKRIVSSIAAQYTCMYTIQESLV